MLWVISIYVINTALLLTLAVREVARPIRALTWIVLGLVLPVVGFLMYWALSRPLPVHRKTMRSHSSDVQLPSTLSVTAQSLATTLMRTTSVPPILGSIQVLTNGIPTYEALMSTLQAAKHTIDMEYYIYRDDHVGKKITDILTERSKAGVHIRFLRDGWGSRKFPKRQIALMEAAGITCRTFFPVTFPWLTPTLNHRDHCKIAVIDGEEAFVGGINIGDEYTGRKAKVGPWRDSHLQITGACVQPLQGVFEMNWGIANRSEKSARKRKKISSKHTRRVPTSRFAATALLGEWASEISSFPDSDTTNDRVSNVYVQTVESGPDRPAQSTRNLFFLSVTQARYRIDITTPYFVPDTDITLALKTAVARGVKVRLLVPLHPDHKLIGLASQTYYKELLEAGVEIYQYGKGILHAKVMTVDEDVSMIGAANYDLRSFRLNYEVSTVMYSAQVATQLTKQFEQDLLHSTPLTIQHLQQKTAWNRTLERGARVLAPLL